MGVKCSRVSGLSDCKGNLVMGVQPGGTWYDKVAPADLVFHEG
jgi:(2Fe-2S) ferredoxin